MRTSIIILSLFLATAMQAQVNYRAVLEEIERNNTILAANRSEAEAEKIGNKTGIYLESPEVEFHYLWGSGEEGGTRTDISATQSFDFPTAYYHKKKVSDGQNKQVDINYRINRKDILLEAEKVCIELTHQNRLLAELTKQLSHSRQIAQAYQSSYDRGDVNIIELNKAKINLISAEKSYSSAVMDRDFYLAELTRLNGGKPINFAVEEYPAVLLPSSFEQWYESNKANNLSLMYMEQEIALSKSNERLQRSMNLPKLSAGYMSEKGPFEQYQGLMVGMSIPLWENKNTVKQIKAQTQANIVSRANEDIRYFNETKALFEKSVQLARILDMYNQTLPDTKTVDLLKMAMDAGEISLIDYLQELEIFYDSMLTILETERDLHITYADLLQWGL